MLEGMLTSIMKSKACRIQWEINSLSCPNKLLRCTYIEENVDVLGRNYLTPRYIHINIGIYQCLEMLSPKLIREY